MRPEIDSRALKLVLLVLMGVWLWRVAAVLWVPLAWGLSRMRPLARNVAVAPLWLVILVLRIGVINPIAAMDDGHKAAFKK